MKLLLKENADHKYYLNKLQKYDDFGKFFFNTEYIRFRHNNTSFVVNSIKFAKEFYGVETTQIFNNLNASPVTLYTSEYSTSLSKSNNVSYYRGKIEGYVLDPENNYDILSLNKKFVNNNTLTKIIKDNNFVPTDRKLVRSKKPFDKDKKIDKAELLKNLHSIQLFGVHTYKPLFKQVQQLYSFVTYEKFLQDGLALYNATNQAITNDTNKYDKLTLKVAHIKANSIKHNLDIKQKELKTKEL